MIDVSLFLSRFRRATQVHSLCAIGALLVGALLRCCASSGELWLDEIWSLLRAIKFSNPLSLLTDVEAKHDNNHLLNSLWLWLCGPAQDPYIYRLPALICSVLATSVLYRHWRSQAKSATNLVWLLLVATSYPIILTTTEARGYSLMLLAVICGYTSLMRMLHDATNRSSAVIFAISGIIGIISHATYLMFLAPAIVWLGFILATTPTIERAVSRVRWVRIALIPPVATATILVLTFYKGMQIGGGPLLPYLEVAASTLSVSVGGAELSASNSDITGWSSFLAISIVICIVIELIAWVRAKDPVAVLNLAIFATPWVVVTVMQPRFILSRYFLVQTLFSYLILARFIKRLFDQGRLASAIAITLISAFIFTNVRHSMQLFDRGRSNFVEIFNRIAIPSQNRITVGGDNDFQNKLRLSYALLANPKLSQSITYVDNFLEQPSAPQFVIKQSLDHYQEAPLTFSSPQGAKYKLIWRYPAPPLGTANVSVYELE